MPSCLGVVEVLQSVDSFDASVNELGEVVSSKRSQDTRIRKELQDIVYLQDCCAILAVMTSGSHQITLVVFQKPSATLFEVEGFVEHEEEVQQPPECESHHWSFEWLPRKEFCGAAAVKVRVLDCKI